MKKVISLIMAIVVLPLLADGSVDDIVRQAINASVDQVGSAMRTAPFGSRTVAVLPWAGDETGFFTGKIKNLLTSLGFSCIEGKEDPMWDEIIKEIAWDERKADILDSSTIVKFGKLKASQILLYGRLATLDKTDDRVYVEIELHATDLETKQHIWGGTFAARAYSGKEIQGIITLDSNLRKLLKTGFQDARASITSPDFASKLNDVKSIVVIPIAGDIDEYITGLAIEMLTTTHHMPKRPQIPSLSQLRAIAKESLSCDDAVFYGALRDLHRSTPLSKVVNRKTIQETSTISADIQLFIEDLKTGAILWSKTITLSDSVVEEHLMDSEERIKARQEIRQNLEDSISDNLLSNWAKIAIGIVCAIVLFLIVMFVKAYMGSRIR